MKIIASFIFILFIGSAAQAQTAIEDVQVDTIEMTVAAESTFDMIIIKSTTDIARLYKRKNTRIKKELTFYTKANRSKTA